MRLALAFILGLYPVTALAMPFLAIPVVIAGVTIGTVGSVLTTVLTVAITIATTVMGQMEQKKAARKAKRRAAIERENFLASLEDRTVTGVATESPHRLIYGECRVGSDVVAMFTGGSEDHFKYLVCVHAAHECESIGEIWIDGEALGPLDGDGKTTQGKFFSSVTSSEMVPDPTQTFVIRGITYPGFKLETTVTTSSQIIVKKHLGEPGQLADQMLLDELEPGVWKDTSTLNGLCYTVIKLDLTQSVFQNGLPKIELLIKGKKLYDPRDGSTAWSDNPALCIRDYLLGPFCNVPVTDIPDSYYITAANVCEEQIVDLGNLFTLNGTVTASQDQAKVLESMAQAMGGLIVGNTWELFAGKFVAPVKTLVQSDIVGKLQVVGGISDSDKFNGIKGQYISSENDYVATDYPPYIIDVYKVADLNNNKFSNVDFPFTDTTQRVINLANIIIESHRNAFTVTALFSQKARDIGVGERVNLQSTFLQHVENKVYQVTGRKYRPDSMVELTMKEDGPSIYDQAATVNLDDTPNTTAEGIFFLEPLGYVLVVSGDATLQKANDGTISARMLASWSLPASGAVQLNGLIEVEWKKNGEEIWHKGYTTGDDTDIYINNVIEGEYWEVRARAVNLTINLKSDWTYSAAHLVIGKLAPPGDITEMLIDGTIIDFNPVVAADLKGYVFRFHYGINLDWGTASPLHDGVITETPYDLITLPFGPVTILAKACDTSGNFSAVAATLLTNQGDVPVNNVMEINSQDPTFGGTKTDCTVVSSELIANSADSIYGDDSASLYGSDNSASFYKQAAGFKPMIYETDVFIPAAVLAGSKLTIELVTEGMNVLVEHKLSDSGSFYGDTGGNSFYGATGGDSLFGVAAGTWAVWPGLITASIDGYQFRISIGGGNDQGKITTFKINIDAPDLLESVKDVVSTVAALNIPYTKTFTQINSITATLQSNANSGITVETDKTTNLTPKFNVYDSTHTAVAGPKVDFLIQGY